MRTAERTLVRNFLVARNGADLIQRLHVGREAAMHAQHLAIDDLKRTTKKEETTVMSVSFSVSALCSYRRQREIVKDLRAVLPGVRVAVLLLALVVEAVDLKHNITHRQASSGAGMRLADLRDLAQFVVAAKERDFVWIPSLQSQQQCEGLQRVVAAVHKVALRHTHEE